MSTPLTYPRTAAPRRPVPPPNRPPAGQPNWIVRFMVLQICCQLLLLSSAIGPARTLVRMAAFGASLLFLMLLPGSGKAHPASKAGMAVLIIVALSFLNPLGDGLLPAASQATLYLAILAPIFWIPRLNLNPKAFRAVLFTFWAFYALSSFFGILQVYFPGRFQPNLSAVVIGRGSGYVKALTFVLANGERVLRPMGLTDMPGGAGTAGFYTVFFGVGFFLTEKRFLQRAIFLISMFLGMTSLYLSQVRSSLVMLICSLIMFFIVLALRGNTAKLASLAGVISGVIVISFLWAVSVGGGTILKRVGTLTGDNASKTYYDSRGAFLTYTVKELLPKYPLGAGLGRWGMSNAYFGDHSKMIWAEIQWTGWLLDGGLPLVIAYAAMLFIAFRTAWRIALTRRDDLGLWAAVLVAYNLGAIALTFGYPLFIGQLGMEFWILNGALFNASFSAPYFLGGTRPRRAVPVPPQPQVIRIPDVENRPTHPVGGRRLRPNGWNGPGQFRPGPLPRSTR